MAHSKIRIKGILIEGLKVLPNIKSMKNFCMSFYQLHPPQQYIFSCRIKNKTKIFHNFRHIYIQKLFNKTKKNTCICNY